MKKTGAIAHGPKPTKACVNCRRLKMKCVADGKPPCRRCRHTNAACIFRPRSNAATTARDSGPLLQTSMDPSPEMPSILSRLDRIERRLGIYQREGSLPLISEGLDGDERTGCPRLWNAVTHLKSITRPPQEDAIWSRPIVRHLWNSFVENLPLLHFLKDQSAFASPSPLLLASILYISALHGSSKDLGEFAKGYFVAQCCAIAELVLPPNILPDNSPQTTQSPTEPMAYQNILGLIMASLSSEAYVLVTGHWIALAYRLFLDHTLPTTAETGTSQDWSGLFSGLQVIDIEHASMHMYCPLLPEHPPTAAPTSFNSNDNEDEEYAFRGLSQMMHQGLSHFVGRGLPTIWSFVSSAREPENPSSIRTSFTDEDARVIRLWARKLDDWLIRYNGTSQRTPSNRQGILILLQYHLHKLYVLSIYHPARGFDLGSSADIAPAERHELLVSARAVVRLRLDDSSIWSNWDLIMITFAAMLLLRGIEDGMSHPDDRYLIEKHIAKLKSSHPSIPSIHHVLAERLESNLQAMHTPPEVALTVDFPPPESEAGDYSWAIFDQEILSLANPPWLFEDIPGGGSGADQMQKRADQFVSPDGLAMGGGGGGVGVIEGGYHL